MRDPETIETELMEISAIAGRSGVSVRCESDCRLGDQYYTTTFGSRVADGVYETLVDGMELEDLRISEGINVLHYLIVDDHFTWWDCGRP